MVADLPASVQRRFDTYILPRSKMPITPLRQISASHIGHLVKLRVSGDWSPHTIWIALALFHISDM